MRPDGAPTKYAYKLTAKGQQALSQYKTEEQSE